MMKYLLAALVGITALTVPSTAHAWQGVDCDTLKPKRQIQCWKWHATNAQPAPQPLPGPAGSKGDKGDKGEAGATGVGERGPAGVQGEAGPVGPAGPAGASGAAGADGKGFASGTVVLVRNACPTGMTMIGSMNEWALYNVAAAGRPWSGSPWSQLSVTACSVD